MFWHEARLSIFCLCAHCILVVHTQFVCLRNFGQAGTFISCYCPLALKWLRKWGKLKWARKCNDLCEPANNSSRHQASFWNAGFRCITLNCKQTWPFYGDAWCHSRRNTMRVASCLLASKINLHSPSANCTCSDCFASFYLLLLKNVWLNHRLFLEHCSSGCSSSYQQI